VDRFFDGSEDALVDYLRSWHSSPTVHESIDNEVRLDAALL
jgi:hypothetical protein